jgi:hypothetical protein
MACGKTNILQRASYAWTAEDEAKLREWAGSGVKIHSMSVRLRRSVSSMKKRAELLGVRITKSPGADFAFADDLCDFVVSNFSAAQRLSSLFQAVRMFGSLPRCLASWPCPQVAVDLMAAQGTTVHRQMAAYCKLCANPPVSSGAGLSERTSRCGVIRNV